MTTVLVPAPAARAPTAGAGEEPQVTLGCFRALEHCFEVLVPARVGFEAAFGQLLAPFRTRPELLGSPSRYTVVPVPEERRFVLRHEGQRVGAGTPRELLRTLAWHLNRTVVDRSAGRYHLMHAAAVTRAGHTVLLPADMESGKTTTAAGLLREGYRYLTDEAVAVETGTGLLHPFPKRLSLDPGSWPLFPDLASKYHGSGGPGSQQWQVAPADLGARTAAGPVAKPSVIVFPRYVRGQTTELVPVSRPEAVHELARMTFHFARDAGRNLRSAAALTEGATLARLRIGDLDAAVEAIDSLVSERLLAEL